MWGGVTGGDDATMTVVVFVRRVFVFEDPEGEIEDIEVRGL